MPTRILDERAARVHAFAWSTDATKLAAADESGVVRIWWAWTGDLVASSKIAASSLAYAPDVDELAVAQRKHLVICNGTTLEERRTGYPHRKDLAYGGAGAWIFAGRSIEDAATLVPRTDVPTTEGRNDIEWRHVVPDIDGDAILMCDDGTSTDAGLTGQDNIRDRQLSIFTADLSKVLRRRSFSGDDDVTAVTFDRTSRAFVFATRGGEIVAWSADGSDERVLRMNEKYVTRLFACGDRSFAVLEGGTSLLAWAGLFEGDPVRVDLGQLVPFGLLAPSPDGEWLAVQRRVGDPRGGHAPLGLIAIAAQEKPHAIPRRKREAVTPAEKAATRLVATAPLRFTEDELRAHGIAWAPNATARRVTEYAKAPNGAIDLDVLARALENERDFAQRTLSEMYAFARTWKADVDETTDRREETADRLAEAKAALEVVDGLRMKLRGVKRYLDHGK